MNFEQASTIQDLVAQIPQTKLPPDGKARLKELFETLDAQKYPRAVVILKALGMSPADENRLFKYPSGRFIFDNKMQEVIRTLVTTLGKMEQISPIPGIKQNPAGLIIPVFFDGTNIFYEPGSVYYLVGHQALVISSIYDAIQELTQHRVESDRLTILLKYIPVGTDFIWDLSTNRVSNINTTAIQNIAPEQDEYRRAITILDQLNQPYPKGYLMNGDEIKPELLTFMKRREDILLIGLFSGLSFERPNTIYERLNKRVCQVPNIMFKLDNKQLTEVNAAQNAGNLFQLITCPHDYAIIGVGIQLPNFKHQMVLLLNNQLNSGYLFDPGYYREVEFPFIYPELVRFFRQRLSRIYPDLRITSIDNLGCPLVYSFQHDLEDKYCVAWSFYLSVLFLLNMDRSFEEIVNHLYEIGRVGLRVIIPRFLAWWNPELVKAISDVDWDTPIEAM